MKKNILIFIVILTTISILTACGSPASKLIGQWERDGDYAVTKLEFFDDGTYTSDHSNYNGNYTINDNRLKITGILVEPETFDFEIKNNTLVLYNEKGSTMEFERVK